jgi:hypothetical protein
LALGDCITNVRSWCSFKLEQLNADKRVTIGTTVIESSSVVRDLRIYFDASLSMRNHVAGQHRHASPICNVGAPFDDKSAATSQHSLSSLVLTFDYFHAVLTRLPTATLRPLQSVVHAAARLVLDLKPRDRVTSTLMQLNWLPLEYRIWHKISLLVPATINGMRTGVFEKKNVDRCR